jgi:hypothetical protein
MRRTAGGGADGYGVEVHATWENVIRHNDRQLQAALMVLPAYVGKDRRPPCRDDFNHPWHCACPGSRDL